MPHHCRFEWQVIVSAGCVRRLQELANTWRKHVLRYKTRQSVCHRDGPVAGDGHEHVRGPRGARGLHLNCLLSC